MAIMAARPNGLSVKEIMDTTDLSRSQVAAGILWIKEKAAGENLTPLSWSRKEGYRFSDDPTDWIEYERSQTRKTLTGLVRMVKSTLDPHLQREPTDSWATMASSQLAGIIKGLEFITAQHVTAAPSGT
ncbi:hypothetical protein ACFQ16_04930 [Saccharopolyspora rosea]|uniref:RacP protein n=1 Tax=Saccharopolyspora rosea TaxID=524884 RepID=A0ABW3FNG0_9PSEU